MSNHIAIILPALGGGGAERQFIYLANDWSKRGFIVTLVLMEKRGELLGLVSSDIKVIGLKVKKYRNVIIPLVLCFTKNCFDVIITAMWPLNSVVSIAWWLSRKQGRLYLSEHENLTESYINRKKINRVLLKAVIRLTYTISNGVIAVSEGVMNDLINVGDLPEELVTNIYNPATIGVKQNNCNTCYVHENLWKSKDTFHILSVGRLTYQKDHATLINAFAILSEKINAELVIVGQGEDKDDLLALIDSLSLNENVSLVGFHEDVSCWYQSADVFVLSSRWEGFGNVIVEALEYGVPVVSTDCPSGPSEIINNKKYGELVPVGNPLAIASAIIKTSKIKYERNELTSRASDFALENISPQYLDYML